MAGRTFALSNFPYAQLVDEDRRRGLGAPEFEVPATRRAVFDAIQAHVIDACPFVNLPEKKGPHSMEREKMEEVKWVEPRVLVEVAFNERTVHGHLRHSKFLRLREPETLRTKKKR